MICQIESFCKTLIKESWTVSLKELNDRYIQAVWNRTVSLQIAESGKQINSTDYILFGSYKRAAILDVQLVEDADGNTVFKEITVIDLQIQRIQDKITKATHALLNDILVPYENFSLRFILYHLHQYFSRNISIEEYCAIQAFDERTFKAWIAWMRQHITILRRLGLTQDPKENRQTLKTWVCEIFETFHEHVAKSLHLLKLGLYQRHRMPERSVRHVGRPPG